MFSPLSATFFSSSQSHISLSPPVVPRAKRFGEVGTVPRKVLGDVSNTAKRNPKTSGAKLSFTIAADPDSVQVQSKKKERKEGAPIFAGGAPGDDTVSLAKLSKELDECFEAFSKPTFAPSFAIPDDAFSFPVERRSPDRKYLIFLQKMSQQKRC